jgi:hypothetical protein
MDDKKPFQGQRESIAQSERHPKKNLKCGLGDMNEDVVVVLRPASGYAFSASDCVVDWSPIRYGSVQIM